MKKAITTLVLLFAVVSHAGAALHGATTILTDNTASDPLLRDGVPVLVPFRMDSLEIKADGGRIAFCAVMDVEFGADNTNNPTIGATATAAALDVTDPGPGASGSGLCVRAVPGEREYFLRVRYADFKRQGDGALRPGGRSQMCSGQIRGLGDVLVNPPCNDTADCTALSAGSCNQATDLQLENQSGYFILARTDTDDAVATVQSK